MSITCILLEAAPAKGETSHIQKSNNPTTTKVVKKVEPSVQAAVVPVEQPKPEPQPIAVQPIGCANYVGYFNQYDWNVNVALAICQAESGGNPNAVSPANYDGLSDFGLMQIHGEAIMDPASNVSRAYQKYQSQGWYAWTTYSSGAYAKYL